jgi:hypothetical protein
MFVEKLAHVLVMCYPERLSSGRMGGKCPERGLLIRKEATNE